MGIGRATAELFAAEGARIVAGDIDGKGLDRLRDRVTGRGGELIIVVGDVSKPEDARRMTDAAVEHFGRLDVLVANAGVIPLLTITEATPEDWDEVMAVDGRGMFLSCKYAIEAMLKTGGGAIVCLSSISGVAGQVFHHPARSSPSTAATWRADVASERPSRAPLTRHRAHARISTLVAPS